MHHAQNKSLNACSSNRLKTVDQTVTIYETSSEIQVACAKGLARTSPPSIRKHFPVNYILVLQQQNFSTFNNFKYVVLNILMCHGLA